MGQVAKPLTDQISVCIQNKFVSGKTVLQRSIGALVDSTDLDALLQSINHNILVYTQSEDTRLRLFALSCSVSLWETYGQKLAGEYKRIECYVF